MSVEPEPQNKFSLYPYMMYQILLAIPYYCERTICIQGTVDSPLASLTTFTVVGHCYNLQCTPNSAHSSAFCSVTLFLLLHFFSAAFILFFRFSLSLFRVSYVSLFLSSPFSLSLSLSHFFRFKVRLSFTAPPSPEECSTHHRFIVG